MKISCLTAASAPTVSLKYGWADSEFQELPESSKQIVATFAIKTKPIKMFLESAARRRQLHSESVLYFSR